MNAPAPQHRRLRPSGGYRVLRSFQTATIIYDGTYHFCRQFIDGRSRTHDQMLQAARSGRQNIAEGNRAGAVSTKSELELTNVARASLEELLLDFQDFLRHRNLPLCPKNSRETAKVRALSQKAADITDPEDAADRARYALYAPVLEHEKPEVRANALICLIHQANYLLDQQLVTLEQQFIETGGFSEQLTAARIAFRKKYRPDRTDRTDQYFPSCPLCGKLMTLRTARQGKKAGTQFWGCTGYPECKGAVQLEEGAPSLSAPASHPAPPA